MKAFALLSDHLDPLNDVQRQKVGARARLVSIDRIQQAQKNTFSSSSNCIDLLDERERAPHAYIRGDDIAAERLGACAFKRARLICRLSVIRNGEEKESLMAQQDPKKGQMNVEEAGRKGGESVREERGSESYSEIGQKGGQRVRELVEEGKQSEGGQRSGSSGSKS